MGVRPSVISAVSGGALMGVLVAAGKSPDEVLDIALKQGPYRIFVPSVKSGGWFTMSRIENAYKEHITARSFEDLKIPMVINATNILEGTSRYFSSGDLLKPLMASASYPALFEPIELDGHQYLDGGILNNFPIEPLQDKVDAIVGISVGMVHPIDRIGNFQKVYMRSLELAINEADIRKYHLCDVLIDVPGLNDVGLFDTDKGKRVFELGYVETQKHEQAIKALLSEA